MIDYILRFPSKQVAEQFGLANGFAQQNEDGVIFSALASHEHALLEIGPHNGENYWILFRDLVGIPIPEGGEQFIYWASDSDTPRPEDQPDVPSVFWA